MKTVLFAIILLVCTFDVKAQQKDTSIMNDTVFISRSFENGDYYATFIEKDTNSRNYSRLTDFTFNEWDSATYESTLESVKSFQNFNLDDLPRKWCPIYLYKEKFHVYAPSEWGTNIQIMLTDSVFIKFYMDGPYGYPLLDFKSVSANNYYLKIANFQGDSIDLKIHVIDTVIQIAIFEEKYPGEETCYYFMVASEKARNFPIIVQYSEQTKQSEFEFETPDFSKYLNK